jgi:drug/metabolite transporter (DMT)-like permease
MRVEPPSRVATSTFVNPVIAMFLGSTLGGEVLTTQMIVAAAIIIGSILLIWKK